MGLIVGGGVWGNAEDVFRIRLPYKQWGSYEEEPQRAGQISGDILRVVSPMFRNTYGISVSYDTDKSGEWNILCEGDLNEVIADLNEYGIEYEGEIRKNVSIKKLVQNLVDDNLKRRFIAGLADTIGSTKKSHRRFNDNKQMISFEVSGFKFDFVCSLCHLLYSINCYPDQILWNHPNFHCGLDPYNKNWKKGFKLRILLDQYDKFGAFAFTSKVESVSQNKKLQNDENIAEPCENKQIHANPSCLHTDENSELLPENIRGGHYLHNRHVCAVMNCPHAPYPQIQKLIDEAEHYINPFPILVKGISEDILKILNRYPILSERKYTIKEIKVSDIYPQYLENGKALLYGTSENNGYPINRLIQAIGYIIAANNGLTGGKRPKGNIKEIIEKQVRDVPDSYVKLNMPDILTPAIITSGNYAAIVGPYNPEVYKKLISRSPDNPYKIIVREITEDDLYDKRETE